MIDSQTPLRFPRWRTRILLTLLTLALTSTISRTQERSRNGSEFWGSRYNLVQTVEKTASRRGTSTLARLQYWNEIAINASGLDHTPVPSGDSRVFGEQLGPGRSSRAMAIVHIAIFDAVNAIAG